MARTKGTARIFTRAAQFTVYLLFRAVEGVLRVLPLTWCAWIGRFCGGVAYLLLGSARRLALSNLHIAFGREHDLAWRRRAARAHFASLGQNFLCGLKLPLMTEAQVAARVTVEGMEHAQAVAAAGKPLLYAVCHLSCWELLTQAPSLFTSGATPGSIYQPLANPFLDAHVRRRRSKLGYVLFDRSEGFTGPMRHVKEKRGAIGVLVDQHAGDKGTWCPFFDRLASTSSLPALMSLRCHAPLLPLAVYDDGPARWRLVCYPPINSGEAKPTVDGVTAMLNIAIEVMVRRAPHNWFWVHNRWKTPQPDFLLSKYRHGVVLPKGYDAARLQKFELLVRSPNWLGDACMAFPAVRALKRGRPDLRLTVLCPAKLVELWQSIREVDDIIAKESGESIGGVASKVRERARFDAAVLFTNSTRSTLELWRAKVPRLVGYRGALRSWLLHDIVPPPREGGPPEHHAGRYLRLAEHCGADTHDASLLATGEGSQATSTAFLGICAGAEYGPAKRWPLENFAAVARGLSARWPQIEWRFFGAPGEAAMGEELGASLQGVKHRNLVGRTSLSQLVQNLKECRLLLTNDTGTMHLAAALGVPTVSIFGSTEPVLTGPLGNHHRIVRHHVPCSPCFRRECPFGHYKCMTGVTVEQVEAEVMRALTKPE
jgi:lipopolysaccharide heptosyltransferase II